jgi:hypothetical protein
MGLAKSLECYTRELSKYKRKREKRDEILKKKLKNKSVQKKEEKK